MVQDPDFLKKLEDYINKVKPEASYLIINEDPQMSKVIIPCDL